MRSIYQRLGEAVEKLANAGKSKQYREASKDCMSVEAQLVCAERLLVAPVKESLPPAVKNNGASDNGHITDLTESARTITESAAADKWRARSDAVMYKSWGLSESDIRRIKGLPAGGETLTASQLREYRWGLAIKLSEQDSLRLAKKVA
ncbi:MAG: hypothetical protein LAP86_19520 [Acidobacteriia bacterium]|nr:hypothetical protein [Terriglobia bacterium]